MNTAFRPRTVVLFIGDILSFVCALWLSLFLRAFEIPPQHIFMMHITPFSVLFAVWAGVFFVAGLYESRSIILQRRAISISLLVAQTVNIAIAAIFFFLVPLFGIAPKTLLLIYLIVSFILVFLWRVFLFPWAGVQRTERAVVVGEGSEVEELCVALRAARHSPVTIVEVVHPSDPALTQAVRTAITASGAHFVIADFNDERVATAFSGLYNFLFKGIRFIDALSLYEEVFGRVPLSVINDRWLALNVSRYAHRLYDTGKRIMDIVVGGVAGLVSLIVYPFVMVAIFIESGGPIFIAQERVGQDNRLIRMYKFRSMTRNDVSLSATSDNTVTQVGKILRMTRLDELPQLWNIIRGDLSLIGPRPELPVGVELYEQTIPYYGLRHLIKPGLSGWAQLYHDNHPHHAAAVEATREKLSYDLYYLKHRSLSLDFIIALKTIKKLLTRSGV